MKTQIKYLEHKTSNNGQAWIGKVEFSKTGQSAYFNNQCFKKLKSGGIAGNYFDLETGDEYWISGVKKNGQDRHMNGAGKINIDENIIEEYLTLVDFEYIDKSHFDIVNIPKTDKLKFTEIENTVMENPIKRKRMKNMKTEQ